jgi:acyl carrier protein
VPGRLGAPRKAGPAKAYSEAEIFAVVQALIVKLTGAGDSKVVTGARFVQDLGCDSLNMVEIVMECEDYFGIQIGERAGGSVKSVENLVDVVKRALKSQPG